MITLRRLSSSFLLAILFSIPAITLIKYQAEASMARFGGKKLRISVINPAMQISVIIITFTVLTTMNSVAATIFETHLPDGTWKVTIEGEIIDGDKANFISAVRRVENGVGGTVSSIHFNSPGGLIFEGLSIARYIKQRKFMTIIESNHRCESICFFMFMYGDKKLIGRNAKLGIHGASLNGKDDPSSTWRLYEKEMQFFIPEYLGRGINGIPSSQMYYLTLDDLSAMGFLCERGICRSDILN